VGSNPTGGTYSIHADGIQAGCHAGCWTRDGLRDVGDLIKVAGRDSDRHLYLLVLVVDVDRELGDLVKTPLQRLGRLAEGELELR
jgi:hypothetical protein